MQMLTPYSPLNFTLYTLHSLLAVLLCGVSDNTPAICLALAHPCARFSPPLHPTLYPLHSLLAVLLCGVSDNTPAICLALAHPCARFSPPLLPTLYSSAIISATMFIATNRYPSSPSSTPHWLSSS